MSDYPIAVRGWGTKYPADLAICERCKTEWTLDPSEGDPYDRCLKHDRLGEVPCGGQVYFKYVEVDACKNCDRLLVDGSHPSLGGCCSRACFLQAEYAAQLGSM